MKQLIVNCERPKLVFVKDRFSKPCQCNYNTAEQQYNRRHKFILHLYVEDTENQNELSYLGALICYWVNADSKKDMESFGKLGFMEIVEYVHQTGYPVDNLAVITDACFVQGVSYDDLDLAFSRIHCVLCEAMAEAFCMPTCGRNVGICFDFSGMETRTAQIVKRFVLEYKDGDMRRDEFNDGFAWYVHKIPWTPTSKDADKQAKVPV